MPDPAFWIDADFGQEVLELFQEFGFDGFIRRATISAAGGGDARATTRTTADTPVKLLTADAIQQFVIPGPISRSTSVFFPGKGLAITPGESGDSIVMKKPGSAAFTDVQKVKAYYPVLRGMEEVILWEADIGSV